MVIQVTVCSRYWMSRTPTMMAHTARNIELCITFILKLIMLFRGKVTKEIRN